MFEYALANTTGDDLAKILWYQSNSSESWLSRRTHFTRSLAVMSVVGYILGLGDRHPSNLMLNRKSGKIIHIDFGDCFEVAMQREKFPETVPFRLTRVLVKAMEVTGVDGTFRLTCQSVMSVMRTHGDSLMATLEAFVHDPLLSWKLLGAKRKAKGNNKDAENSTRRDSVNQGTEVPPLDSTVVKQLPNTSLPATPAAPEPKLTKTARMLFDSVDTGDQKSKQSSDKKNTPDNMSQLTPVFARPAKLSLGSSLSAAGTRDDAEARLVGIGSLLTSDYAIGSLPSLKPEEPSPPRELAPSRGAETQIPKFSPATAERKRVAMAPGGVGIPLSTVPDDECDQASDDGKDVVSVVEDESADDDSDCGDADIDGDESSSKPRKVSSSSKKSAYGADMYDKMASMSYTMKTRMSGVILDPAPPLKRSGPMTNLAGDTGQSSILAPRDSDETVLSNVDIEDIGSVDGYNDGGAASNAPLTNESKERVAVSLIDESFDKSVPSAWGEAEEELFNEKGILVIQRVSDKLTGLDFDHGGIPLDVKEQIDRLIKQATSNENLCACFFGWCPFW